MTSSNSESSSEAEYKQRKRTKQHKHKEKSKSKKKHSKKDKRHKDKKHQSKFLGNNDGPKVLESKAASTETVICEDSNTFGPTLPPHLQRTTQENVIKPMTIIGPVMPSDFLQCEQLKDEKNEEKVDLVHESDDDDDDDMGNFGPLPPQSDVNVMTATQIELEERALALKLAAIDGTGNLANVDQKTREEWMLELPDVGLKGGLAALGNMKRTFYQGKERPDFSDRSSWTKTPQNDDTSTTATKPCSSKDLEKSALDLYARKRDAEQESIAKKHKKKHKREESLVEMHQKKLRKEQRKKEKELAASGIKPERRPFSRDVDLKLNKIDKNQTKQIVDKAKILNTKFSSGHTKYL